MAPLPYLLTNLFRRSSASPSSLHALQRASTLTARDDHPAKPNQPQSANYNPGALTIDPTHVNNRAYFALFAILGAAMVLAAIWFFFIHKNGGFVFRRGDWDDYKSTVLRRKGPNGTTLSGATKTTRLGGGSVVANEGDGEKGAAKWKRGVQDKVGRGLKRGKKNNEDADMRAYRAEKPARVGGLNREADGVRHGQERRDFAYDDAATSSDRYTDNLSGTGSNPYMDDGTNASTISAGMSAGGFVPINTPRKNNKTAKKQPTTPSPKKMAAHNKFYATPASNASNDSQRPLRPNAAHPGSGASTPTRSPRNTSPRKGARQSVPGSFYTDPLEFETRYTGSENGTEDSRGTKAYFHPIPGLSGDHGNAKGRTGGAAGGFRRGGGRRDSLSDSEGETNFS